MKKIINLLIIISLIISWKLFFISHEQLSENYKKHIRKADIYYGMKAYKDAYDEYQRSEKYSKEDEASYIFEKKTRIMLFEKEYQKARKLIDEAYLKGFSIDSIAHEYLETCLKDQKYKDMNLFLDKYSGVLNLSKFEKRIKGQYHTYPGEYQKILQLGEELFLLTDGVKEYILDQSSRKVFTSYYDGIIGFDEANKLITAKVGPENILVDFKKNIRSKLVKGNISPFINNYYVVKASKNILKNQINESLLQADYISSFTDKMAIKVEKGNINLIDMGLKVLKTFKSKAVKEDASGRVIFDKLLILKSDKERIYDIENEIYSAYYDEIDFSRGGNIAVRKGAKWGFINRQLELITEFKYDKANSFSNGIAYVEQAGEKLFIDETFAKVKGLSFEDFINFNRAGVGFIKTKATWKMIRLIRRIY